MKPILGLFISKIFQTGKLFSGKPEKEIFFFDKDHKSQRDGEVITFSCRTNWDLFMIKAKFSLCSKFFFYLIIAAENSTVLLLENQHV